MGSNYKNFEKGIGLVPNTTTQNSVTGDLEVLTSDNRLHLFGASTNDTVTTDAVTTTLTNKTLTAPVIATIVNGTGTLTLPSNTNDTLVARNTTDTLTNKSMDGGSNTFTNIPGSALPANVVTTTGTQTLTNKTLTAPVIATINNSGTLTLPTGPDTLVGRATTDTLTNKTLTSPIVNGGSFDTITGQAGIPLLVQSAAGQQLQLNAGTAGSLAQQVGGTTISTTSSTGTTLASAKTFTFTNNSQTVSLSASSTASASYSVIFPAAAPNASTALVYNGTNYVWSQAGGWTTASATAIGAGGTIALGSGGQQFILVAGVSSAVTLSTTPFGTSPPTDGTVIRLVCNDNTNTVSITNNDAANGCIVNGTPILYKYNMIEFQYSSTLARYLETDRNF